MRLKDHCELIMQLLNSPYVGQQLELEEGGSISKLDIEHFVIVHSSDPSKWEERNKQKRIAVSTRRRRLPFDEDDLLPIEDEGLVEGEEKVTISKEEELHLIRKLRKIACGSTSVLADGGWFICPVYVGMESLNPIVSHRLPNKRGYRLTILSTPIAVFSKGAFASSNLKTWELNSIPTFNRILPVGLQAMSVFVHKRDDLETRAIRNAVNRLETTQRTRIKLGNILVDEVRTHVGQEAYVSNKESLSQTVKGKGDSCAVTQYDMDEVKTIHLIEDAYSRVNSTAIGMGIKDVPIHRKVDFVKATEKLKSVEEEEHEEKATEQYRQWMEDDNAYLSWRNAAIKKTRLPISDVPNMEAARLATSTLTSMDYIPSYVTYLNTKGYMEMKRIEADAKAVVHEVVHTSWLWPYIEGIKGCGEVTAAYILADIDFRSTIHPSSVLRYLGLDNVADVPKRKDGDQPTDEDLDRICRFLFHDYESILKREEEGKLPPIEKGSFYQYATDTIGTWEEYVEVQYVHWLLNGGEAQGLSYREAYEVPLSDGFSALVDKVWKTIDVVEYVDGDGNVVPTIKKRARGKQDATLSTYLTADGTVATKRSLGYNAKLKSRILEVMFDSMTKAKNPYYYGEVYLNHKRRLEERYRRMGIDPSSMKMRIHRMARRVAVQVFIEELWMHARTVLGYPLNGGTYYEAKLKGTHGHGSNQ